MTQKVLPSNPLVAVAVSDNGAPITSDGGIVTVLRSSSYEWIQSWSDDYLATIDGNR